MRMVYGVGGEGKGHATRSGTAIAYLLAQGHEIDICASSHAYDYLAVLFRKHKQVRLHRIQVVPLVYKNGKLSMTRSILGMFRIVPPATAKTFRTFFRIYATRNIEVVISDFEIFTSTTANIAHLPLISANNISVLSRAHVEKLAGNHIYRWWSITGDRMATGKAAYHVIPTFFPVRAKHKNVLLTSPVVRPEVTALKTSNNGPIVVYQTSSTNSALLATLKKIDEEFIVYGYGARPRDGNLKFFAFNQGHFLRHIAHAKALIIGGGFSLMSEGLYLRKPIFCVPVHRQYEQCLNAHYLQRLGLGKCSLNPTPREIKEFISELPLYRKNLAPYNLDPAAFSKTLHRVALKIRREPEQKRLRLLCKLFRC